VKVVASVLYHSPVNLGGFTLSEMDNKRYHSTQYQKDAHEVVKNFWKNHYDDTEDKGDDSSNQH
jgi:hypothetical protein